MVSKQESRIYFIEKGRLIFVENDLDNPNRIAVSVSSGTTIQVYDESLIGFMSDGKFYSWTLKGYSTKLAKNDAYYIYARLSRTSVDAMVVFSVNRYNLDGSLANAAEGDENLPNEQYYYVLIGEVTATDGTTNREVTYDSGMLGTTKDVYENAGSGNLNEMFQLNKTSDPWYIIAKHAFWELTIKRSLKLIGSLIWGDKELQGVHTTEDLENNIAPDDAHLATSAYTQRIRDERYLRKDQDDRTEHSLGVGRDLTVGGSQTVGGDQTVDGSSLVKGLLSLLTGAASSDFLSGFLGSGFELRFNQETGRWRLEIDELMVRMLATFFELVIHKIRHVGGSIILSPASMECVKVEDKDGVYRCYFKATDGEKTIKNEFVVGDQARCQSFNLKQEGGITKTTFYWRLVTAVGDDWIELSKSDCADGSGAPEVGDDIVQLGNRNDTSRQNAIILDTVGSDAPSIKQYALIDSYSVTGKEVTVFSPLENKIKGRFINVAGEDINSSIIDFKKQIEAIKAKNDRELTLWFYDYTPTLDNPPASEWSDEEKSLHLEDLFYNRVDGIAYRFTVNGSGVYSWEVITDQDTIRALEKANQAQDTADGKRRTFVSTPTDSDEYDVGDLWVNATYGELYSNDNLVCKQSKRTGEPFSITHWSASSNATTAYIQNLGDEIRQVVADNKASGDAATAAAQKAADDAAKAAANAATAASNAQSTADSATTSAANAQSTADAAKSTATANATAITQTNSAISQLAGKFEFDADGNVTNVKQSGVLMSADAASIYTKQETTNALGQRVTTAEAKIETSVRKDYNGNIESSAKISADQITMNGTVKFSTQSEVSAAKSDAISAAAADATYKANTAQANAEANAAKDATNKVGALEGKLGKFAFLESIKKALEEETIIVGGYIKTALIDVGNLVVRYVNAVSSDGNVMCKIDGNTGKLTAKDADFDGIKATNADVNGKITATSGKVAGFSISGEGLTNEGFDNDAYVIFRNDTHKTFAGIGGNVIPPSSGLRVVARFENHEHDTEYPWDMSANYAMLVSAQGGRENIAIQLDGGSVACLALKTQIIGHDNIIQSTAPTTKYVTLGRDVGSLYVSTQFNWKKSSSEANYTSKTRNVYLTLPTMDVYDDGHVIKIKRGSNDGSLVYICPGGSYRMVYDSSIEGYVRTSGTSYIMYDGASYATTSDRLCINSEGDAMELVYHRDLQIKINNTTYYGCWIQYKHPRNW